MKTCSIQGCNDKHEARSWCQKHYARWKRFGDPLALLTAERGTAVNADGYRVFAGKGEHILVAEKAMGKRLPNGAVVHHVDENRLNNAPSNLVVCSRAYHILIHARMKAMAACGNPNWRHCYYCKRYDDPANMYVSPQGRVNYHSACRAAANAKPFSEWKAHRNSKSQLLGAHWHKGSERWHAVMKENKRTHFLGAFLTADEAHAAYMTAKAAAIKSGAEVPGAHVEQRRNLQVK
jgi:hypothetical protein